MKAASRLFKSKYTSGRCPICKLRIVEGQLIVRLDKPVSWIEQKKLVPYGGGRFFTDQKSSQFAHADCLEEYNERKTRKSTARSSA